MPPRPPTGSGLLPAEPARHRGGRIQLPALRSRHPDGMPAPQGALPPRPTAPPPPSTERSSPPVPRWRRSPPRGRRCSRAGSCVPEPRRVGLEILDIRPSASSALRLPLGPKLRFGAQRGSVARVRFAHDLQLGEDRPRVSVRALQLARSTPPRLPARDAPPRSAETVPQKARARRPAGAPAPAPGPQPRREILRAAQRDRSGRNPADRPPRLLGVVWRRRRQRVGVRAVARLGDRRSPGVCRPAVWDHRAKGHDPSAAVHDSARPSARARALRLRRRAQVLRRHRSPVAPHWHRGSGSATLRAPDGPGGTRSCTRPRAARGRLAAVCESWVVNGLAGPQVGVGQTTDLELVDPELLGVPGVDMQIAPFKVLDPDKRRTVRDQRCEQLSDSGRAGQSGCGSPGRRLINRKLERQAASPPLATDFLRR